MAKKDKEKDESEKKEEISPMIVDPKLDKTVLHNLSLTPTRRIIRKIIETRKEEPEDEQG